MKIGKRNQTCKNVIKRGESNKRRKKKRVSKIQTKKKIKKISLKKIKK